MRNRVITAVAGVTLALAAQAGPTKDPADLTGTWTLDERSSDDPVRELSGEHGRGGGVVSGVTIFGIPVGKLPRQESDPDDEETDPLRGVEHVFEATYRLLVNRDGDVTEIRYGNAPTITYRDGVKTERDGATARAQWEGGVFTVEHELADGSRVTERYWVEARSDDLQWTVHLTRRKGSVDVERDFYRTNNAEP